VPRVGAADGDRRSSWHSILVEYEQWALSDGMVSRRDFGEPLMTTLPTGLTTTSQPPAPLFTMLIGLKMAELERAGRLLTQQDAVDKQYAERALEFWRYTFDQSLYRPFEAGNSVSSGEPVRTLPMGAIMATPDSGELRTHSRTDRGQYRVH
jgi:hypothetical protein